MLRNEKIKDVQGECRQARLNLPGRHPYTKAFSLALSALMLVLVFVSFDPKAVGLCRHLASSYWSYGNLTYHFFHASLLHWLLNVWCFLSCVFLADMSLRKLLLAYVMACSAPALSATPTIGFSGVCFALLGMVMWRSAKRRSYNIIIGVSVLLTLVLCPRAVNNLLHLYCYILGILSVPVFRKTHALLCRLKSRCNKLRMQHLS